MRLFDVADHVNRTSPDPGLGRSAGVHVSELVERIATTLGYLDPQDWDTPGSLRVLIGQSWENYLGPHLEAVIGPSFCWQPGEIELDNIYGTPDGLELSDRGRILHEIKATWISLRNPKLTKRPGMIPWYNECQIKCYCKMTRSRFAVLHRLYLNSTYRPPQPYYWPLGIEFTQEELDTNWRMITHEAAKVRLGKV